METIQLPTLGYFQNGNGWLASSGLLRFQIEKPVDDAVTVVLWQGPFSRPYAQELGRETFPVTADGLAALSAFLTQKAGEMKDHPTFTAAETTAYYQAQTAAEQPPKDSE